MRITTKLIIGLLMIISASLYGQQESPELVKAIREGDARTLSGFFHKSLEMTILDKDYVVSKEQATRILEDFFKSNKPVDFTISFGGEKDDSHYSIGNLKTKDKNFRVNLFFIENQENKRLIYFLSIEPDEGYAL